MAAAAKIRAPDKGICSYLGDISELERGRGRVQRLHPLIFVPWKPLHRPVEVCHTRSQPLRLKFLDKEIGALCFTLLTVQCPGGGSPLRTVC